MLNLRVTLVALKNVKYPVYKYDLIILNKDGKQEWLKLNDAYLKVLQLITKKQYNKQII